MMARATSPPILPVPPVTMKAVLVSQDCANRDQQRLTFALDQHLCCNDAVASLVTRMNNEVMKSEQLDDRDQCKRSGIYRASVASETLWSPPIASPNDRTPRAAENLTRKKTGRESPWAPRAMRPIKLDGMSSRHSVNSFGVGPVFAQC